MRLVNKSRNKALSFDLKQASSFSDQLLGLLKKSNPRSLMFKTRYGIHTFFMDKPIDVVVLDGNFKVVKLAESLQPNRLFFWNPRYNCILELPEGVIKKIKTQVGDTLEVELA